MSVTRPTCVHCLAPFPDDVGATCPSCGRPVSDEAAFDTAKGSVSPFVGEATPTVNLSLSGTASEPGMACVPGYEILGVLGRGGMGVVYRARHLELKRVVALKMILAGGHAGPHDLARFQTEAEAVARLQHPNIVQIFEVGRHHDLPYFSLELVEGGSLASKLAGNPIPDADAAAVLEPIARAMQVAHARGIVHRDLKPANILLQIEDCRLPIEGKPGPQSAIGNLQSAIPKVTDFGLAKQLGTESGQTQTGAVMGTPSYMAPEQAMGQVHEIGPAADVYALGAMLYEMLTGRPPFKGASAVDTLLMVTSEEPMPPSRLVPKVSRDLEIICLRCLAKQPAQRYASAQELADDLQRYREGRPILARPIGSLERLAKWARRRPAAALLVGVSIAASIALLATGLIYQGQLEDRQASLENALVIAKRAQGDAERGEKAAKDNERLARRSQFAAEMNLASQAWRDGETNRVIGLLFAHHFPPPRRDHPLDFRGFEYFYLWRLCHHADLVLDQPSMITGVAYAPDGNRLYSAGARGTIGVWDTATGKAQRVLDADPQGRVTCLALSPDGSRLAAGCGKGVVRVWDCTTFQEKHRFMLEDEVSALAFTARGRMLAVGGDLGVIRVADLSRDAWGGTLKGHAGQVLSIASHPTHFALVSCSRDGTVRFWDLEAQHGRVLLVDKSRVWQNLAVSPDGQTVAMTKHDGVRLYDWGSDQVRLTLGPGILSHGVAFSPDGRHLASTGVGLFRVWSLPDGKLLSTYRGFTHLVRSIAFSSDGLYVAGGEMGQVKAWRLGSNPERIVIAAPAGDFLGTPVWHGSRVALVGRKGGLQVWDRDKREPATNLVAASEEVGEAAFSPDGQRLAAGMADGSIRLFAVDSGRLLQTLPGSTEKVAGLAITPDGTVLAAAVGAEIILWRLADGVKLKTLPTVWMQRRALAIAPDGRRLAATGTASFEVWDLASGRLIFTSSHERTVGCLAFSADSRTVACGEDFHAGGRIKLWDATDGKLLGTLQGHKGNVSALAFAPDGNTLASGGSSVSSDGSAFEGEVRLWDPVIGQERATLIGANNLVTQLWFAADGKSLTATDIEGRSVIWQAADPAETTGLHPHDRLEGSQRHGVPQP